MKLCDQVKKLSRKFIIVSTTKSGQRTSNTVVILGANANVHPIFHELSQRRDNVAIGCSTVAIIWENKSHRSQLRAASIEQPDQSLVVWRVGEIIINREIVEVWKKILFIDQTSGGQEVDRQSLARIQE